MKRNILTAISVLLLVGLFTGCSQAETSATQGNNTQTMQDGNAAPEGQENGSDGNISAGSETESHEVTIPQEIQEIPDAYFPKATRQGTLEELYYDTFESFSYRVKEGYSHDGVAAMEYTYNGMKFFWNQNKNESKTSEITDTSASGVFTADTAISDVINNPVFGDYGRLIFPADAGYYSGSTLGNLSLTWYSNIRPDKTVEIINYLHAHAAAGETVFYDIYTDEEKAADPDKEDTGLFFFRGRSTSSGRRLSADRSGAETPGAKFAICNAGGGFAYVGAMHDSFPHALELSKKGYNAFALIYRPGAQTACEDLARAIAFIFDHADELGVDTSDYSLWGGSAGARMAAWLGSYGTESSEKMYIQDQQRSSCSIRDFPR